MVWKKKESPNTQLKADTLLGKNARFEGILETEGAVRIDGCFKGTIKAAGDVVVGEEARAEADITGKQILIAGEVRGGVMAQEKLEFTGTGKLFGNMQANCLVVEEGAVLQGDCRMAGDGQDNC